MKALAEESFAAAKGMNAMAWERLHALGVSRDAVADAMGRTAPYLPVGILRIEVEASGLWQPSDEGRPAMITPATVGDDSDAELVDLVAWRSTDPLRVYSRNGQAWALGLGAIDEVLRAWEPKPLDLHASPLDWLAAGGSGCCVVDWNAPEVADLRMVGAIAVPTSDFGRLVRDRLMRAPRLPVIRTASERVRHAA